jgi:hypothetical protein
MITSLLAHATGIAALGLSVRALVVRSDRELNRASGLSAILWALNNLTLGAHAAAALSAVAAGRQASTSYAERLGARTRRWGCAIFVAVSAAAGALTWEGWTTVPTTVATMIVSYAVFYTSGARLRLIMLASALAWMYNAWALHSWEQILANALTAAAASIGAWRTRLTERQGAA